MTGGLVWITGARGFIGRHLARSLNRSGLQVAAIGHGAWPEAADWGVGKWMNAEPSAANLSQLARDAGAPGTIYHLAGGASVGAAMAAPREDFSRTVETTAELLDWARLEVPATRIVAVSSAAVYGDGHSGPIAETALTQPFSQYGAHKMMMEELCRAYSSNFGLQTVTARLFSVYGPHLRKQLIWDLCNKAAAAKGSVELGGSGTELRDWTHVSDVVRALQTIAAEASEQAPVLNVGTGRGASVNDIAEIVIKCWDSEIALNFSGQSRPGDPQSLVADAAKLVRLGFEWQVRLDDGLRDYVRWFHTQKRPA